jgi:hypothetical protein
MMRYLLRNEEPFRPVFIGVCATEKFAEDWVVSISQITDINSIYQFRTTRDFVSEEVLTVSLLC